jgi:hypothetical protein
MSNRIPLIITSKDRAQQLQLLLRSLEMNADSLFEPIILWKASTQLFAHGYEKLIKKYRRNITLPKPKFMEEYNFRKDYMEIVNHAYSSLICGAVDDDIFYRKFEDVGDIYKLLSDKSMFAYSLRLGMMVVRASGRGNRLVILRWDTPSR